MEVPTEQRAIDLAEVSTVKEFCSRGCGCAGVGVQWHAL